MITEEVNSDLEKIIEDVVEHDIEKELGRKFNVTMVTRSLGDNPQPYYQLSAKSKAKST